MSTPWSGDFSHTVFDMQNSDDTDVIHVIVSIAIVNSRASDMTLISAVISVTQ